MDILTKDFTKDPTKSSRRVRKKKMSLEKNKMLTGDISAVGKLRHDLQT